MKPERVLHQGDDRESVVILTAIGSGMIYFVGASCPTSADPGDKVHSFAIRPTDEYDSVALVVESDSMRLLPFIIHACNDGGARLFLDEPFTCTGDRLAQLDAEGRLRVRELEEGQDPKTFTSDEQEATAKGYVHIPNTNLLCRLISGHVKAADLIAS